MGGVNLLVVCVAFLKPDLTFYGELFTKVSTYIILESMKAAWRIVGAKDLLRIGKKMPQNSWFSTSDILKTQSDVF